MIIEEFGAQVASVWEGLRSTTRHLVEKALQASVAGSAAPQPPRTEGRPYDARADLELSRLLAALDERTNDAGATLNADQEKELRRIADTTAIVLQSQTQSAEVFAQLVGRAHRMRNYARIDQLADTLKARFAPSEICELARSSDPVVRALAQEALALAEVSLLVGLLVDPVDSEIARAALERKAVDYGSEEARRIVYVLDQADSVEDDL